MLSLLVVGGCFLFRYARSMRLVSWNVNSLKARLPRVEQLLTEHKPDVVCLQETKANDGGFPHDELRALGYTAVDRSAGRWAGVAILARAGLDLAQVERGLPGEPVAEEARWIEADVAGIRVASVYVPNGRALDSDQFPGKLAFLDAMLARVKTLAGRPLVVMGDFNVARADRDLYDPAAFVGSTHVTPPERDRVTALVEEGGLVDAYRRLEPEAPGFTWWDYRAGNFHKKLGMRIDLALVTPDLADRLTHCDIDRNYRKGSKPSDHAPLLVDLRD
jgi:exodeoxyribonuclease-3